MELEDIILKVEGSLAWIYINREGSLNALRERTFHDINRALDFIEKEKVIRVVLIRGMGDKAFVAGADIKQFLSYTEDDARRNSMLGHQTFSRIEGFAKPVIALINGYALGGGLELALACHIRIASENARLGLPEINLGIMPGYGGTVRLPRLIGKGKALMLTLTGKHITAEEALKYGIVDLVVPHDKLNETGKQLAEEIASKAPIAISCIIRSVYNSQPTLDDLAHETELFVRTMQTQDAREGISAFIEKRKPSFKGE